MSEAVMKLRPIVESLTDSERDELMDYVTQLQRESLDAMLDRRRREYETGVVKGVPAVEVFSKLREKYK